MRSLNIIYDNVNHAVTLGGSLVLRQEVELLSEIKSSKNINIFYKKELDSKEEKIINIVFKSSNLIFKIYKVFNEISFDWPLKNDLNEIDFSYHSFSRINKLFYKYGKKPRLDWNIDIINSAKNKIKSLDKNIIAIHLKNVEENNLLESNIDTKTWVKFFDKNKIEDHYYLLIGDDAIPSSIDFDYVFQANRFNLSIEEQLALIPFCKGFIGLASGMCTSANFSNIPYVILKHPDHHREEMESTFNSKNKIPFFNENQHLWRTSQNKEVLQKALELVIKK